MTGVGVLLFFWVSLCRLSRPLLKCSSPFRPWLLCIWWTVLPRCPAITSQTPSLPPFCEWPYHLPVARPALPSLGHLAARGRKAGPHWSQHCPPPTLEAGDRSATTFEDPSINGATLKWSGSCRARGAALSFSPQTFGMLELGKITFALDLSKCVSKNCLQRYQESKYDSWTDDYLQDWKLNIVYN